jgi:uncharacterized membrane protein
MKRPLVFITKATFAGLLIVGPIYLATLLLLKGIKSVMGLVRPVALLLPDWLPAETALSALLVLLICFLIGVAVRTQAGQSVRDKVERTFFERVPGYALLKSLTQQVAGESRENVWRPVLFGSGEALRPGFIIEEFEDGRYTVFVPSSPSPLAGAVYILDSSQVHPLDVSFPEAFKAISRWGSGARDLITATERGNRAASAESASGLAGNA